MAFRERTILITGASMGIGAAIARRLAAESATLILFARSDDKLKALSSELTSAHSGLKVLTKSVDVQNHEALSNAVRDVVQEVGYIDTLINNAGLAVGAPNAFPELKIEDIITMSGTNVNGFMFATYAVLNQGKMRERGKGTILNVTSVTGLELPPFSGEAVYHASKAYQEAFTNSLRNELVDTDIKVLALRPGVVQTNFHQQRVGYDKKQHDEFIEGYEPLIADDIAEAAVYMLSQKDRVSIKAMDVVPTAQRSLQVFDRNWNSRSKDR
ncbi:short chain dehydrogenase/ reductase-like protein [Pyrenochaeta sp. DS3sAY3a]|nr:short chain dehydrogenase/ reductase-like protein [Pyrenochaeta sp. DS3sAY3a]